MRSARTCLAAALFCGAAASAQAQVASAQHAHHAASAYAWEAGTSWGYDFGTEQSLWAVSLGRRLGDGLKAVFEYADGQHAHEGAKVTSIKLVKEVGRWQGFEFGLGLGGAYVSERHDSGWGVVLAGEMLYPLTPRLSAKLELSRLFGVGGFNETRATVQQGGIVFLF